MVSEILQQFKFISQDVRGVHERYPSLRASLSKLLTLLFQTLAGLVKLVMDKSKVTDSSKASQLLAGNLLYTLINYGGFDTLIESNSEAPPGIEEHLYLHFLPFLDE